MAKELTAGDLRKILHQTQASWTVDSRLKDEDPIPVYPTGGYAPQKADPNARIDFRSILATAPAHSFLLRIASREILLRGLLTRRYSFSEAFLSLPEYPH